MAPVKGILWHDPCSAGVDTNLLSDADLGLDKRRVSCIILTMKPEYIERHIETVGEVKEQRAGLAAGCERFVFDALRKLYSDRIKSLMREYFANAKDEHNKLGIAETPFEVTFPNSLSPVLSIRDFARGLTESEVFYYFGNYGASDKRDDNLSIGKFGFGNKSALAYTDAFNITSFKDGVKMDFTHYIDQSEVGILAKLGETPTDEPNGVLITIPVQNHDIHLFTSKGFELIRHFKTTPIIKGLTAIPDLTAKAALIAGTNWEYFGGGSSICLMGEIAYPIDTHAMGNIASWERTLLNSDLHITVNIGDVEITPSREELQMSPLTIAAIKARLTVVKNEMLVETQKQFVNCKNIVEAKSLYYATIMSGSGYGSILRDSMAAIDFNGEKITDNIIDLKDGNFEPHRVLTYSKNWRSSKVINYTSESRLVCTPDMHLFYDDTDRKIVNYKRRAKTLLDGGLHKSVTILQTDDVAAFEKLTGVTVKSLPSYNAVVPTAVSSRAGYGTGTDLAKRAKHQTKVFMLDRKQMETGYKLKAASDYWTVRNIELQGGLYLNIDRFHPTASRIGSMETLKRILEVLKAEGIVCRLPIYGLKAGADAGKLVPFETWITKKVSRRKTMQVEAALAKAYGERDFFETTFDEKLLNNGLAKDYITLAKNAKRLYNDKSNGNRNYLLDLAGITVKPNPELAKQSKEFLKAYPMMNVVDRNAHQYNSNASILAAYLNETKAKAATAKGK